MKYKTLFRLMIKAIGVYLVSQHAVTGFWTVCTVIQMSFQRGVLFNWGVLLSMVATLATLGIGLHLFFGGEWIVNKAIPRNRPYCPECAYDLSGAASAVCPECGTPFRWEDVQPRGQDDGAAPSDRAQSTD